MDYFNKIRTGKFGENLTIKYLLNNHYKIIKYNHCEGYDELDIIAEDMDRTLVFIEVKTIRAYAGDIFMPEDHLSPSKLKRITRACRKFAARYDAALDEERGWRIDLVAIRLKEGGRYDLRHYRNI